LQRWNAFKNHFDTLGVSMVTISMDTVDEIAAMKKKLGFDIRMLSDESMAVTERYNLKHEKAMAGAPGRKIFRPLSIPTAILVDADGIVRWIDQADDYRIRSDADLVLAGVKAALA
jgi:peroxiredoxin